MNMHHCKKQIANVICRRFISRKSTKETSDDKKAVTADEVIKVLQNMVIDKVAAAEENSLVDFENINTSPNKDEKLAAAVPKPFSPRNLLDSNVKEVAFRKGLESLYMAPSDFAEMNWSDRWPVPRPFNPYLVPLPIRMGYPQNKCVTPDKYNNLELIKLQNFLHLTPPAVKKQCEALKEFCTPFPSELKSDEACEKLFPIETHTVDYITASNSVKDDRAKTVTKTIRLCNLVLNDHARRKMIQLLGKKRYDEKTDVATIKSRRCPLKKQNSDFIDYVLTALYFESWTEEKWETREQMNDYDCYYWWENSNSHQSLKNVFEGKSEESISKLPEVEDYRDAVTEIKLEPKYRSGEMNEDRSELISKYKQSVLKLLNLSPSS